MSNRRRRMALLVALAVVASVIAAGTAVATANQSAKIEIEVAEDPSRYVPNGDHVIEDGDLAGFPAYGDFFVTQGWIYPKGTLQGGDGITCDVEDGLPVNCVPEFPELVIGEWTCYGVHVGEGAATTAGSWVATTQIFDFGEPHGRETIVTDGFETPESGKAFRAITGGTGQYLKVRGQQVQKLIGFGEHFNVLLENELRIRK